MFKSDYADNVEIAFVQWGNMQDEFKQWKKSLFILRKRDRAIRRFIEKNFRKLADKLFTSTNINFLNKFVIFPFLMVTWVLFVRLIPSLLFSLIDLLLFISIEIITLLVANLVSVFILLIEVFVISGQSIFSYFFNVKLGYPNIYINYFRKYLYITEIWLSPPNFCREKDKWKNERHQYDLYEYEQSVKVI